MGGGETVFKPGAQKRRRRCLKVIQKYHAKVGGEEEEESVSY